MPWANQNRLRLHPGTYNAEGLEDCRQAHATITRRMYEAPEGSCRRWVLTQERERLAGIFAEIKTSI